MTRILCAAKTLSSVGLDCSNVTVEDGANLAPEKGPSNPDLRSAFVMLRPLLIGNIARIARPNTLFPCFHRQPTQSKPFIQKQTKG